MAPAISRETLSMKLRSTVPSGWGGVGTAMKMISRLFDAFLGGGEIEATGADVLLTISSRPGS